MSGIDAVSTLLLIMINNYTLVTPMEWLVRKSIVKLTKRSL
jgi:hypothetical protein